MKSLLFPILFAFCFAILLIVMKTAPAGKAPSLNRARNQGLLWPSASVRCSSAKANIHYWLAFFSVPWAGNKNAIFHLFLTDTLCSSKGKKELCKFKSCRPHQNKRMVWYCRNNVSSLFLRKNSPTHVFTLFKSKATYQWEKGLDMHS